MRSLRPTIPVVPVLWNLNLARTRERQPPERIRATQGRLLSALVQHAHAHVPHYRRTLDPVAVARLARAEDLAALPVLARSTLSTTPVRDLLADTVPAGATRVASTSGSSGIPVTLHYSERDLGYLRATFLHDLIASGMRPWDRIGYFRVGQFRRHRLERLGLARNVHINTSWSLDEQVRAFLAGRPTFLFGFPSAILSVVEELARRGVAYSDVHTVIFAGERTTPAAREHVLGYLGATAHEVYSSVEAYTIARTCRLGALHLREADVVVEVLHDDGSVSVADGAGEILVTRLHAEAMPLIRYHLGDRVEITPNDCACGVLHTPVVRRIQGRVEDRIVAADGRLIHADFLTNTLVTPHAGIRRLQIVQDRPGAVEILVVPDPAAPHDLTSSIERKVGEIAADLRVTARAVAAITPEANGKIRIVKVRMNKE